MKSVRCRGKAQMLRLHHHQAVTPGNLSSLLSLNVCISKMKFCTAHRWMRGLNKIKQVKSPFKWQGFRAITQAIPVYSACYWYVDGKSPIEVNGLLEDRTHLFRWPWVFRFQIVRVLYELSTFTPKHTFLPKCPQIAPNTWFSYSVLLLHMIIRSLFFLLFSNSWYELFYLN